MDAEFARRSEWTPLLALSPRMGEGTGPDGTEIPAA